MLALTISGIIFLYSLYNGMKQPTVKTIRLEIRNLPPELDNFSIVHLSDFHITNGSTKKWLRDIVEKINTLTTDIVLISGDMIQCKMKKSFGFHKIFQNLESKYGVFAVTGNHDFYAGIENLETFLKDSGIVLLRNKSIILAKVLRLIGIDDDSGFKNNADQKIPIIVDELMKHDDGMYFNILLYHRPRWFEEFSSKGIDLQLSGHTHGGQFFPVELLVPLFSKYPYGLYKRRNSYLYTNSGVGYWGPPLRTFSKFEIVEIILVNKDKNRERKR